MSTREFAAAAVDSETGWSPGKSLVAKITSGQNYNITPQLVSAIAAGLDMPREVVAAAAHLQTIGYTATELTTGAPATLIRTLGVEGPAGPKSSAVAERWDAEA
ncbi:hypothetical protein [Streptomyces sp. ADI97-07]|uniref:hypothetical protein n=1 Tax=Streptomyces sp. ADI97-07 TaxID=1522762 RepID=UPI001F15039C|nr:hypothetical protein [Streptomyces sp. ADI97-07]